MNNIEIQIDRKPRMIRLGVYLIDENGVVMDNGEVVANVGKYDRFAFSRCRKYLALGTAEHVFVIDVRLRTRLRVSLPSRCMRIDYHTSDTHLLVVCEEHFLDVLVTTGKVHREQELSAIENVCGLRSACFFEGFILASDGTELFFIELCFLKYGRTYNFSKHTGASIVALSSLDDTVFVLSEKEGCKCLFLLTYANGEFNIKKQISVPNEFLFATENTFVFEEEQWEVKTTLRVASVAVQDGKNVMCYDFSKRIVPHPLCHAIHTFDCMPSSVASNAQKRQWAAKIDNRICVYSACCEPVKEYKIPLQATNYKTGVETAVAVGEYAPIYFGEKTLVVADSGVLDVENCIFYDIPVNRIEHCGIYGDVIVHEKRAFSLQQEKYIDAIECVLPHQFVVHEDVVAFKDGEYVHFITSEGKTSSRIYIDKNSRLIDIVDGECLVVETSRSDLETFYPGVLTRRKVVALAEQKKYRESFEYLRLCGIRCDIYDKIAVDNGEFVEQLSEKDLVFFVFEISGTMSPSSRKMLQEMSTHVKRKRYTCALVLIYQRLGMIEELVAETRTCGNLCNILSFLLKYVDFVDLIAYFLEYEEKNAVKMLCKLEGHADQEYLAILETGEGDDRRRYRILTYLRKYEKALECLDGVGSLEEIREFVFKHDLTAYALSVFKGKKNNFYVNLALERATEKEKPSLLKMAGRDEDAVLALLENHMYCEAIDECTENIQISREMFTTIQKHAEKNRYYNVAARLSRDKQHCREEALRLFFLANNFQEAHELQLSDAFAAAAREFADRLCGTIDEHGEDLLRNRERLERVRALAKERKEYGLQITNNDVLTEKSSTIRTISKKKGRKPRIKNKEGSFFEEEYVVSKICETTERLIDAVGHLCVLSSLTKDAGIFSIPAKKAKILLGEIEEHFSRLFTVDKKTILDQEVEEIELALPDRKRLQAALSELSKQYCT